LPRVEHEHVRAQPQRLADVVGHEHHGDAGLAVDAGNLGLQLPAGDLVHGTERLVHQEDVR
jgi:hypothetical protein